MDGIVAKGGKVVTDEMIAGMKRALAEEAKAEEFDRDRSTINYVVRCVDKKLGREIFNRSVGRPGEEVTLTRYGEKAVPILRELLDQIEATDIRLGLIEVQ